MICLGLPLGIWATRPIQKISKPRQSSLSHVTKVKLYKLAQITIIITMELNNVELTLDEIDLIELRLRDFLLSPVVSINCT